MVTLYILPFVGLLHHELFPMKTLLHGRLRNILSRCYPLWLLTKKPVRVLRVEGRGPAGPASLLIAASDSRPSPLTRHLFAGETRTSEVGRVPVWLLDSFLRKRSHTADLTLVRVDSQSARLFFQPGCLRVPDIVDLRLTLPSDLESLWRGNGNLRDDLRRIRSNAIEPAFSESPADFEFFCRSMYLPFIARRYGDLCWPASEEWLRDCFSRGRILWAVRGGEKLAGCLVETAGGMLWFRVVGTRDGEESPMKRGAVSALYLFAIRYAHAQGIPSIHFGSCLAAMGDGVMQYKRKWRMSVSPRAGNRSYTLLRWEKWNGTVAAFLRDAAVIHSDGASLNVVTACAGPEPGAQSDADLIHRAVSMPGIDRLLIVAPAGWQSGVTPPPLTTLISGRPSAAELASACRSWPQSTNRASMPEM